MRKTILTAFVLVMTLSAFAAFGVKTEAQSGLSDLGTLGQEEVFRLYNSEIVAGFPDGTFRPDLQVTRGQAITMIGRALGLNGEIGAASFPDVNPENFASGYIASGAQAGIINGFSDGTFRPNDPITRKDMARILTRAFPLSGTSSVSFFDITPYSDGYEAIQQLAAASITEGYPDSTFRPRNTTSRLEFSLFVARVLYPEYRLPVKQVTDTKEASIVRAVVYAPSGLQVRTEPALDSASIGTLQSGAIVQYAEAVGGWAKISHNEREAFVPVIYLRDPNLTGVAGRTIVVDAGHGGKDPGAVAFGIHEADVVLSTALMLEKKLKDAGANVVMTRRTDVYLTLSERVQVAQSVNADAFISIHANAATTSSAHGTETFWNDVYATAESKELATKIQQQLIAKLQTRDRGVKEANFHVLKNSHMPSVLVELGFLTNEAEAKRLATTQFQMDAAEAMYQGIMEFYQ